MIDNPYLRNSWSKVSIRQAIPDSWPVTPINNNLLIIIILIIEGINDNANNCVININKYSFGEEEPIKDLACPPIPTLSPIVFR